MRNKHLSTAILCMVIAAMVACKSQPSDAKLREKVSQELSATPEITGDVSEGVVTLAGTVTDDATRAGAEASVKAIEGVKSVINNVMVAAPPLPVPDVATNPGDEALRSGITNIAKDFPDADIKVEGGVITVTGKLSAAKWRVLKQALDALHPQKVDATGLTIK